MTTDKKIEGFALDILDCYRAIENSYNRLPESEKEEIEEHSIHFSGFDGNHELPYVMKVQGFHKEERYMETKGREFTHMPMVGIYREMIDRWQAIGRRPELSAKQILEILGK